jgi:hypothetical protein
VAARARDERGFGLIELMFAMLMLNIGILALVAAFNEGAMALGRSAAVSSGTTVADKMMEVYRGLENKAIYLNAPSGGGSDNVSGLPNGIPNGTSTWYAAYSGNASAYSSTAGTLYYSYTTPPPQWVTQTTTGSGYAPIPATDITKLPSGLSPDPTKAVQKVQGPDGQNYTVFVYITLTQAGGYVKQVTIVVYDPRDSSRILARESSLFDPNVAP